MEKTRDTFIFYRSFHEAISDLEPLDKLAIYEAIADYSLNMKSPKLSGTLKMAWTFVKPILDSNIKKWENGSKAKRKQTRSKKEANGSKPEAYKDKDKDKDGDNNSAHTHDVWGSNGVKPPKDALVCQHYFGGLKTKHDYKWDVEEVATRFFEHYAAKNWMVNNTKITNWTYKANEWARSEKVVEVSKTDDNLPY